MDYKSKRFCLQNDSYINCTTSDFFKNYNSHKYIWVECLKLLYVSMSLKREGLKKSYLSGSNPVTSR